MRPSQGRPLRPAGLALIAALAGCYRSPSVAPLVAVAPDAAAFETPTKGRPKADPPAADLTPFRFPQDDLGRLLQEILGPAVPASLPRPTLSYDARAAATRPFGLDHPDAQTTLPALPGPAGPRLLTADKARPVRLRPTREVPQWDSAVEPERPARPPLPCAPRAVVDAPDPQRLPAALITSRPAGSRLGVDEDSTLSPSREGALAVAPSPRETPIPSARVSLPDPFETLQASRLVSTPPDDDPPTAPSRSLPQRPPLPTQP